MPAKKDEFDPGSLVGLVASEAKEIAERHGYTVQIVPPGGGVTLDLRAGRINLTTDGTRVTNAWFG